MKRALLGLLGGLICAVAACQFLLPERYRVNAPLGNLLFQTTAGAPSQSQVEQRLQVPEGFSIALYADEIPNARFIRFTSAGDLLVTTPRSGQVRLLHADRDGDGRADGMQTLLADLKRPHGLDLWQGWLYIGEGDAIGRIRFDAATRSVAGDYERIVTGLPEGGNHWTRTVRIGPDGGMYVSVGSSCNVCVEKDARRATMLRFETDGSGEEIHATGLRNSAGFDWQPETQSLYATDNGRDLLGDDFPPCELNRIERGAFYGWPFANGDRIPDPDHGDGRSSEIADSRAPAHSFRAHNAPLGITFVRRADAPSQLQNAALVALHGSWNRTRKDGYKVVSLHWDADGSIREQEFAWGFEREGDVIGRPVDVAEGPDGAFYISDDYAGAIWRVSFDAAIARGQASYDELDCASCHEAARAAPGVIPVPLAGLAARHSLDSLLAFLETPTPPMPPPDLEPEPRADLAAYLLQRFE